MGKIGQEGSQERTGVDGFIQGLLDRNKALDDRLKQLEADEGEAVVDAIHAIRAKLWHDESIILTGGARVVTHEALQNYGFYVTQATPADADSFTQSVMLEAGTYTFIVLGVVVSTAGKIDWYIDDVLAISGQDWYSAGTAYNILKSGSVTVIGSGRHKIKGVINGKNASSSAYNFFGVKMWFEPAADTADV